MSEVGDATLPPRGKHTTIVTGIKSSSWQEPNKPLESPQEARPQQGFSLQQWEHVLLQNKHGDRHNLQMQNTLLHNDVADWFK
jgi:hypothetical protein